MENTTENRKTLVHAIIYGFVASNLDFKIMCLSEHCVLSSACQTVDEASFVVGDRIIKESRTILQYRINYNNTPDLLDDGISCMLSFAGKMSQTFVPYEAIVAVVADIHQLEFAFDYDHAGLQALRSSVQKPSVSKKPSLRLV